MLKLRLRRQLTPNPEGELYHFTVGKTQRSGHKFTLSEPWAVVIATPIRQQTWGLALWACVVRSCSIYSPTNSLNCIHTTHYTAT